MRLPSFGTFAACSLAIAAPARAQVIDVRTIPLASGSQYTFFPSQNASMGGVSIALQDSLLDPFVNPAKGARMRHTRLFTSPAFYGISNDVGSGRSLPLGFMIRNGATYGVIAASIQQINQGQPGFGPVVFAASDLSSSFAAPSQLSDQNAINQFAFGSIGTRLGGAEGRTSIAASAFIAGLKKIAGLEYLYPSAQSLTQKGKDVTLRLGLLRDGERGRSYEALAIYDNYDATHDATFVGFQYDPMVQTWVNTTRVELNRDHTRTFGLQLGGMQPIADSTYRLGVQLTANRMTHPKIPNYQFMSIPRDPGYTTAFSLGSGIARIVGPARLGIDFNYEPIWSRTWADSTAPISGTGSPLVTGRTVENRFRFGNASLRLGFVHDLVFGPEAADQRASLSLGLGVKSINYHMDQTRFVPVLTSRSQDESWLEWTPTWGMSLHFTELEVRYVGRHVNGTGIPGAQFSGGVLEAASPGAVSGTIIAAPSGPLSLTPVGVTTHQIVLSVPLGR